MRERGGGGHQQAQNLHAARVRQEFDLIKDVQGFDLFHYDKGKLNCESKCEAGGCQVDFYLTCPSACDIRREQFYILYSSREAEGPTL